MDIPVKALKIVGLLLLFHILTKAAGLTVNSGGYTILVAAFIYGTYRVLRSGSRSGSRSAPRSRRRTARAR